VTDFESSLSYLYGLQSHGIKPGLSRTITLLEALGDPHTAFQVFHVAGTNGKGSTAAMLASILSRQGYRVGLYTSPHLVNFTERIQVGQTPIPDERLLGLTVTIRQIAESRLRDSPTFFEAATAMAFAYFAELGVQFAVIEVGLGGRFDATNVVTPHVSVITTIGVDHQQYLGNTLEEIAREKAGIIKPGVPVIVGSLAQSPDAVIRHAAAERQASAFFLGTDFGVVGEMPARFSYRGLWRNYDDLACALDGRHQLDNAGCALAALEAARERGTVVTDDAIRDGLRAVRWPGRLELVGRAPDILLDGAHNPQAAEALAAYLTKRASGSLSSGRLILVIGMMRDKDHRAVLAHLAGVPGVSRIILTHAAHPRAAEPEILAHHATDLGLRFQTAATVGEAFAVARSIAGPADSICVTGSLLVVGEIKAILQNTPVSALRG
jgi:dihydrofolate synthase / folylpolyglutamate synthase